MTLEVEKDYNLLVPMKPRMHFQEFIDIVDKVKKIRALYYREAPEEEEAPPAEEEPVLDEPEPIEQNDELKEYIKLCLSKGLTHEEIKTILLDGGWNEDVVSNAMQ